MKKRILEGLKQADEGNVKRWEQVKAGLLKRINDSVSKSSKPNQLTDEQVAGIKSGLADVKASR
jgi:predicted transcriptional regulator